MTILKNKVALVTGSARGIGKAIALRYATLGADIVVNYSSDETNASQTVAEIKEAGRETLAVKADISKPDEIDDLFAQAIERFGRVDIVVANAGVETNPQPVADVSEEQFDRLFGVNTKGAFFTLQKAAQRISDNGRIIYIGSSTTCDPMPGFGLYGSSKMAAGYLVGVLAQELGPRRVTVNAIVPTAIDGAGMFTGIDDDHPYHAFMEEFRRPIGARMGRPEDVANAAEYFASDIAEWVSGQQLLVSGGAQQ